MKFVLAMTGASGSIYMQRLLLRLDAQEHEVHLVLSVHAKQVAASELPDHKLQVPEGVHVHDDRSMYVPFTSGSTHFDAMAIVPCSMGTLARVAAGTSDNNILRAADVFLKERRKLILVPRETPWNLIQARNVVTVIEAGALVMPAVPSFYHRPDSVEAVADTVVFRLLDHLGVPASEAPRWQED